jgi:hypothetical protein
MLFACSAWGIGRPRVYILFVWTLFTYGCDSLREISTDFSDKPKVTSFSPADVATQVALTSKVVLEFSQDMDRASVEQNFSVVGQKTVTGTISWSEGTKRLAFTPTELEPFVTYKVKILKAAKDKFGKQLAADFSSSFSTFASSRASTLTQQAQKSGNLIYHSPSNKLLVAYMGNATTGVNTDARMVIANKALNTFSEIDLSVSGAYPMWNGSGAPKLAQSANNVVASYMWVNGQLHALNHFLDSALTLTNRYQVTRTNTAGNAFGPDLIYNQTDFTVLFSDFRFTPGGGALKVFYARMDASGSMVDLGGTTNQQISSGTTSGANSGESQGAYTANGFGVAWPEYGYSIGHGEIFFARTNLNGVKQAFTGTNGNSELRVTTHASANSLGPSVAYGGQYFICFTSPRGGYDRVYLARVDTSVGKVAIADPEPDGSNDDDLLISEIAGVANSCHIIYNADKNEYAMVWFGTSAEGYGEVFFQRIATDGTKINSNIQVTSGRSTGYPSVAWTGSAYAISYVDTASKKVYLAH